MFITGDYSSKIAEDAYQISPTLANLEKLTGYKKADIKNMLIQMQNQRYIIVDVDESESKFYLNPVVETKMNEGDDFIEV